MVTWKYLYDLAKRTFVPGTARPPSHFEAAEQIRDLAAWVLELTSEHDDRVDMRTIAAATKVRLIVDGSDPVGLEFIYHGHQDRMQCVPMFVIETRYERISAFVYMITRILWDFRTLERTGDEHASCTTTR